jgi:hypothetical protein
MTPERALEVARELCLIDFRDPDDEPYVVQFVSFLQQFAAIAEQEAIDRYVRNLETKRLHPARKDRQAVARRVEEKPALQPRHAVRHSHQCRPDQNRHGNEGSPQE